VKSAPVVVALLVSHDGARWLPQVIEGLRAQRVSPHRVLAVDTGSKDASRDLISAAFGPAAVLAAPGSTSFPAAVNLGVDAAADAEWIWILHDDSTPDPGALAALLDYVDRDPRVDIVGPKLRDWPSLRRLQEIGVTMSGTGRRETGLERGEYDQGQHDQEREVLAVHSAGMLIRRTVLSELRGFDERLPIFGNDLDLGWRAAQAGFRTVAVPSAVVFHAEAAHRGVRRTSLTGRHTHYAERRAALFTLLANVPSRALPFQALRILVGSLVRVLGFLSIRAVGQALDELAAVVSLYAHPRALQRARRERRELVRGDPLHVRGLLPPWWVPYRHGLDAVADLISAATQQAQDVAERRRLARQVDPTGSWAHSGTHAGGDAVDPPTDRRRRLIAEDDDEELPALESGVLARFLTSPIALAVTGFLLLSAWALRGALGGAFADGAGALGPAPARTSDWWRVHLEGWHALAQGTAIPAPPYVLPFAVAGAVLPGGPRWVVALVLTIAVPVGFWGAWRFLRVAGHLLNERGMPRPLLLVGAAAYSLVCVSSGAWSAGRFGIVVGAALLPWLAHAALGFAEPSAARRWRAGWRSGMFLFLIACFTPQIWLLALVIGIVIVGCALGLAPRSVRARSAWGPPALALAIPGVVLAPWWVPLLAMGAGEGLLLEAGRLPFDLMSGFDLAAGRVANVAGPPWIGLIAPTLALVALVPAATRLPVLICWIVGSSGAVVALLLGHLTLTLPALTTASSLGVLAVFFQGVSLVAVTLAAQGLLQSGSPHQIERFGWTLAALLAVVPIVGVVWAAAYAGDRIAPAEVPDIPAYMTQSSTVSPAHGVLIVRGTVTEGLRYAVRRGDGLTIGEDEIVALSQVDEELTEAVVGLASQPTPELVGGLAGHGIEFVVLTAPADGQVASRLDAVGGLTPVSTENRDTRAWQVDRTPEADAVAGSGPRYRYALVGGQLVAIVVGLIMCGPGRRPRYDSRTGAGDG
jgi:GT2 family glycosyltransferase